MVVVDSMEVELSIEKQNLFWLALSYKVLIWDNCNKRAWENPSRCVLCKLNKESLDHLSVRCPFSKEVWNEALKLANEDGKWEGESTIECFKGWCMDKKVIERWHGQCHSPKMI